VQFLKELKNVFPKAKILAGVGGTFDFLTGKIKRAPQWMRKAGREWLWRLAKEPKRIRRIISAIAVFPWIVLTNKKN
jgi:N-acetylglucosaminyldiphosphoundecaprenol N-acetyl-beta-D-mannosaminyltransferase